MGEHGGGVQGDGQSVDAAQEGGEEMNREIKFKAWDEKEKKMFSPSSISWKDDVMWICDNHGENKLEYELVNPSALLMQYTGFKEREEKEIWESDIARIWDSSTSNYEYHPIVFQNGSFYLTSPLFSTLEDAIKYSLDFEIVGNIYENPELLIDK